MKTLKELKNGQTKTFKGKRIQFDEFEKMGFNPEYEELYLTGDYSAYELDNGEIAEVEVDRVIVGRWDKEVYNAITWE